MQIKNIKFLYYISFFFCFFVNSKSLNHDFSFLPLLEINILLMKKLGINVYDSKLFKKIYLYSRKKNINNNNQLILKYYKNDIGYILCLNNNILYLFDKFGNYIISFDLRKIIKNTNILFLNPYKSINSDLYIILGNNKTSEIFIKLIKLNLNFHQINEIKSIKFNTSFGQNINCQIINNSLNKNDIACFYLSNQIPNVLSVDIFDFNYVLKQKKNFYYKFPLNINFDTIICKEKNKIIIYYENNFIMHYIYYFIEINEFHIGPKINIIEFTMFNFNLIKTNKESDNENIIINILINKIKPFFLNNKTILKKIINNIYLFKKYNNNIIHYKHNKKKKKNISLRFLNESLIKCKKTDEIGLKNSICIECNTEKGYFPLIYNYPKNIEIKNYFKYKDCYNDLTKPINYFFNSELKVYEKCYESCLTCFMKGDQNNNNCILCNFNYIFLPEIKDTTNCVIKCSYYYYSLTGEYSCAENYHCPEKVSLVIEDKNKCIYDCKMDDIYKYQYNGECLESCPENTKDNKLNICLDKNIEKCTLTIKNSKLIGMLLKSTYINDMAKRFAKEFSYTNNHISQFIIDNYLILFYKNKSCLLEMNLNNSIIDFDECLLKINNYYNIPFPLIVIIDRFGKYNNTSTQYAFFNPITGDRLNTSFCENTFIFVKKNISSIYNKEEYDWLIKKNIDIYNINSSFYSSPCFSFETDDNKDLILKDRLLLYYPNASICEEGCEYEETNYTILITSCKCIFNETNYDSININLLEDESYKIIKDFGFGMICQLRDLVENMKFPFLVCFKNIFSFKYFIKNIGGFIILILLIIQIICIILLFKNNSFIKINRFILIITELYINYKTKKNKIKNRLYQR